MKPVNFVVCLVFVISLIQGCASTETATVGGYYVTKDNRDFFVVTSDASMSTKVKSKLIFDKYVKARHINVDTHRSIVTLNGYIPSQEMKERVILITKSIRGVKKIITRLIIIPPPINS